MNTLQNQNKFLNSHLVLREFRPELREWMRQNNSWLAHAICEGWVVKKDFYPQLAKHLKIEFLEKISIEINSSNSVAQMVPLKLLVENDAFPVLENNKLVIVVFDPFKDRRVFERIASYTGHKEFKIAISPPGSIRLAIQQAFYYVVNITSEELINVLNPGQTSKTYANLIIPKLFPTGATLAYLVLLVVWPLEIIRWTYLILNVSYFVINPFKLWIFMKSLSKGASLEIPKAEIDKLTHQEMPKYSVLVPLRDEAVMARQIVQNITILDYPKDLLDIKFVTEVDDKDTNEALELIGVGRNISDADPLQIYTQLVKVPPGSIATKPRSVDYSLNLARGKLTTIYDAEDKPDLDQLKKVVIGFKKSSLDTVCIQSKLNYYNTNQNLLTKIFSLEYGFWFDYYLPGLSGIKAPIPLGGTSNHFVTSTLRKLGSWDGFNVTEDADLGLRIFRNKLKTNLINSYTLEEANSQIKNWIRQRTRWQKGFLVTFLVHFSSPLSLLKKIGLKGFLMSVVNFGGNFYLPLFNVALWIIFLLAILGVPLDANVGLIAMINLIVGNGVYIFIHAISAYKMKKFFLLRYCLLLPVYWWLISLATIRAGYQYSRKPFYWEKTKHGL